MRIRFIVGALALIGSGVSAQAADMYGARALRRRSAERPQLGRPLFGGNVGYRGATSHTSPTVRHQWRHPGRLQLAVRIHMWRHRGRLPGHGASDTFAAWKFSNPWFGTLRGRGGFAMNNILIYGTGGLAFGNVRAEVMNLSENHTAAGWTLGAGAEIGITQTGPPRPNTLRQPERQPVRAHRDAERLSVQRRSARRELQVLANVACQARTSRPGACTNVPGGKTPRSGMRRMS